MNLLVLQEGCQDGVQLVVDPLVELTEIRKIQSHNAIARLVRSSSFEDVVTEGEVSEHDAGTRNSPADAVCPTRSR